MRKLILLVFFSIPVLASSQGITGIRWSKDANAYYKVESGEIAQYTLPANTKTVLVSTADLTPEGASASLGVRNFVFSEDQTRILVFTNTVKVCFTNWEKASPHHP